MLHLVCYQSEPHRWATPRRRLTVCLCACTGVRLSACVRVCARTRVRAALTENLRALSCPSSFRFSFACACACACVCASFCERARARALQLYLRACERTAALRSVPCICVELSVYQLVLENRCQLVRVTPLSDTRVPARACTCLIPRVRPLAARDERWRRYDTRVHSA